MVFPSTAEDVSTIIKTVVAGHCPFGVKGGGHGSFALSNSVEHGVTIDFGKSNFCVLNTPLILSWLTFHPRAAKKIKEPQRQGRKSGTANSNAS